MKRLSVNIDHIGTLRQARQEKMPDPVYAAVLAELAGADGITCHLRGDRRHIQERDLDLLRKIIKTELNLEMAATPEMLKIALKVQPDIVTLVPERADELTTEGGLDLIKNYSRIKSIAESIKQNKIKLSVFIEADEKQVDYAKKLNADQIELNTNSYCQKVAQRKEILRKIKTIAAYAQRKNLIVHCGHGLDYNNIKPILTVKEISGFSIGFSIIARAVLIGLGKAVSEMKDIITNIDGGVINEIW